MTHEEELARVATALRRFVAETSGHSVQEGQLRVVLAPALFDRCRDALRLTLPQPPGPTRFTYGGIVFARLVEKPV